jgi:branched-chain amino acid aminotransferase
MLQQRSLRLLSLLSRRGPQSTAAPLSASLRCRRAYSIHADASVGTKIQDIDPTKLTITKTQTPKDLLPPEELIFGRNFSGGSFGGSPTSLTANYV